MARMCRTLQAFIIETGFNEWHNLPPRTTKRNRTQMPNGPQKNKAPLNSYSHHSANGRIYTLLNKLHPTNKALLDDMKLT